MSTRAKTKGQLTAATLLDVITVLKQGQEIQAETARTNAKISETLVEILQGQNEIKEQIRLGVMRGNEHSRDIGVLKSAKADHEKRIQALEKSPVRPARAG